MTRPGWPDAVDGAPTPVEQVVDLDSWTVTLDLHKTSILAQLAAVFRDCDDAATAMNTLISGQANGLAVADALDVLRSNWRIRDSLTITWAPVQADQLADRLKQAAFEPDTCVTGDCGWLAQPGTNQCAECLAAAEDQATSNVDEGRVA